MTKQHLDKQNSDTKFNVQAEAQKQKMDQAATKHAGKIRAIPNPMPEARTARPVIARRA